MFKNSKVYRVVDVAPVVLHQRVRKNNFFLQISFLNAPKEVKTRGLLQGPDFL